jgi:hypothetical protein
MTELEAVQASTVFPSDVKARIIARIRSGMSLYDAREAENNEFSNRWHKEQQRKKTPEQRQAESKAFEKQWQSSRKKWIASHRGSWLTRAVQSAGRAVQSLAHAASEATGAIGSALTDVPLIGPGLHGAFDVSVGPFSFAESVVQGERIDKAVFKRLKQDISDVKEVAPYAQTVVSVVPGVGQGVSGALGAGLALAGGQPITQALEAGVKGAIPGGALAEVAFDVGQAALSGRPVEEIGIAALPLSEIQKKAVSKTLKVAKAITSGKNVPKSLVESAEDELPPVAKKALNIGMAMGHAKSLQKVAKKEVKQPGTQEKLAASGIAIEKKNPVFLSIRKTVPPQAVRGYDIGIGLMGHQGVNSDSIATLRETLYPSERVAFDLAVSTHVGTTSVKKPILDSESRGGYYATFGMMGAHPKQKTAMMKILVKHPATRHGAKVAIKRIAHARKGWWIRLKEWVGFA